MPESVRRCLGRFFQDFWYDVTMEVEGSFERARWSAEESPWQDVVTLSQVGAKPCCCSYKWWRAKILYSFLPFDLSPFGQAKDVSFWVMTALTLAPLVRCVFYAF